MYLAKLQINFDELLILILKMKYLITGASGLIGKKLVKKLLEQKVDNKCFDH